MSSIGIRPFVEYSYFVLQMIGIMGASHTLHSLWPMLQQMPLLIAARLQLPFVLFFTVERKPAQSTC